MQAHIRLNGETAQTELSALADWLSREDEFRGRSAMERPEARPGHMGGISEVVIVALGAQGAGTALAASLSVWIRHRRPSADIEVTGPGGETVKISLRNVPEADLETVLRRVLER
ncbi:effector-associated constant component EACC1 [Streptomyces sp. IBSBF 2435]|uniref:effector-associated constant component EACC1 n=1 Tax=Streptomyces sp. IBSBF 2435 TaxID=2903531 RepID=UPI002FDC5F36